MANPLQWGELRGRFLIGATLDDDAATAWFSNFGYHDVATSLATLHSAILKSLNPEATINVFNHPLEVNYSDNVSFYFTPFVNSLIYYLT